MVHYEFGNTETEDMADQSKKESKAKVSGVRERLRSETRLAPDQAEPVAPRHSERLEDREDSPERVHEASESETELEDLLQNMHHTLLLMENPKHGSMIDVVQTKPTSQTAGFDGEEIVDRSPNEGFAGNTRESLPYNKIDAKQEDDMALKLALEDSVVKEILQTFDSHIAQIYANIKKHIYSDDRCESL